MSPQPQTMVFINYLTTVFDNIKDHILLISVEPDHKYRLLLANKAFSSGTGHAAEEVGKPIDEIVTPETYKKLVKRYDEAVKTKKTIEFVDTYEVPVGRYTFGVKIIPVISAVGEVVRLAVISQDITDLQNLRDLAASSAETLEQMARELREG